MNRYLHNTKVISVILMVTILLSGCATAPTPTSTAVLEPTPTESPTMTPIPAPTEPPTPAPILLLSKPPELILATDKPSRNTTIPNPLVYQTPEMDKTLIAFELVYYTEPEFGDLKVDIYYPPNYNFETKLPVVIVINSMDGPGDLDKNMTQHIDWAKLIAAYGMIAVSAQTEPSGEVTYRVMDFLAANADKLGLDFDRIGFWACSGQTPVFVALEDQDLPYREAFKAAALTYMDLLTARPSLWPKGISLFVVKAERDRNIVGGVIDDFVTRARASNLETEYIELTDAPHGYDVFQNTQASRDTVKQTVEFLRDKLLP